MSQVLLVSKLSITYAFHNDLVCLLNGQHLVLLALGPQETNCDSSQHIIVLFALA